MPEFVYPTNAELDEIAQDLIPRLVADRPVFEIMPMRNVENYLVMWEQEDNYVGLQQVRGLGGMPPRVSRVGVKRFQMEPGVYGEHIPLDEVELTIRRQIGTFATTINVEDLVLKIQNQLLGRRLDRIESICWSLLVNGAFSVAGPSGAILHTDQYNVQTFSAIVPWGTAATSTPLADFRSVQLLARGHSIRFDSSSRAYMNQVTLNRLLNNSNVADVYGRRTQGLGTINSIEQMNMLLAGDNLPKFYVYDEGYLNDSGVFVPHLADGVVIVVGRRTDGSPIGEYQMTRNVNNANMAPGPYMRVIDRGEQEIPRTIEVHDGHNGGPALKFPSAIVRMNV